MLEYSEIEDISDNICDFTLTQEKRIKWMIHDSYLSEII